MTKSEFLEAIRARLTGFPEAEIEESLRFYGEMIDDRMEDGMAEDLAVSAVGSLEEIVAEIKEDHELLDQERISEKPKARMKTTTIVLLAVGSPIWVSLGAAAFAVLLSLFVTLWAAVVSLWAAFAALGVLAAAGVLMGVMHLCGAAVPSGLALIGASLIGAGLAILLFIGGLAATKGILRFVKFVWLKTKHRFVKGGVR